MAIVCTISQKCSCVCDHQVLLAGGTDSQGTVLDTVALYDPTLNRYSSPLDALPQPRAAFAAVAHRSNVALIGGYSSEANAAEQQPDSGMLLLDL